MKLKLDENLGSHAANLPQTAGHDVATVAAERLVSASDREVIDVCRRERRCLVTLDLDFGNPFLFRPSDYAGIAVLRLPAKPSHGDLLAVVRTLIGGLVQADIAGKLWIVQAGRLREYQEQSLE
jgi:hypothetical protein